MTFHRLSDPTYFGGLPAGYDKINDPQHVSVGAAGVPAPVDGIKASGPNEGSYFVTFKEDGRAFHTNRGLAALAENCDHLDDTLRTSIPVITFGDATAVGSVATHALTGEIWVGENGLANNQANRDKIVRITDQNNNDLEVSGTKIVATLIHDGASVNVVGTIASGFRTNASVNVSPSIPNGTTYRVWHGIRNSLTVIASTNKGDLFREQLRTVNNIPGEVRSLFRQIHAEAAVGQLFDAAFDSTIRSLASAGLNERYRRATTQPSGFVTGDYNVAGGGAIVTRDGQAVTIREPAQATTNGDVAWPDKNLAALKITSSTSKSVISGFTAGSGGDIGYWHEGEFKSYPSVSGAEVSRATPVGPGFVEVIERDVRAATASGNDLYTFINNQSDATLNPDSDNGPSFGPQKVECAAGQYFCLTGPTRTAIRVGFDYLEITWPSGRSQTFVISAIFSDTTVLVSSLRGLNANFGNVAVPGVRIRWLQASIKTAGVYNDFNASSAFNRVLTVIAPAVLSEDPTDETIAQPAFFGAVSDEAGNLDRTRALEWGVQQLAGGLVARGSLTSEGGVYATLGVFNRVTEQTPDRYAIIDEEFYMARVDTTLNQLISTHTWSAVETGSPAIAAIDGTAKNPGQLQVTFGDSGSDDIYYFSAGASGTGDNFDFSTIEQVDIIVKVTDDVGNLVTTMRAGLCSDNTLIDGGDDSLVFSYNRGLSTTQWQLFKRIATVQTTTNIGAITLGHFAHFRLRRNGTGLDVFFNGSLVTTLAAAAIPTGACMFGALARKDGTVDTGTFTVFYDKMYCRAALPVRHGA